MTCTARCELRVVSLVAALTLLWMVLPAAANQIQGVNPRGDYQYKKDYAQYEGIMKEQDAQKRADLLLAFVKEHPMSRMLPYVSGAYNQVAAAHGQAGNLKKSIEMYEAFLAPVSKEKEDQLAVKPTMLALLSSYYQAGNLAKAAEVGERINELAPEKGMNAALADIYLKLNNSDKFLFYAEKILAEVPLDQSYSIGLQMAGIYLQKQDVVKAREMYSKIMEIYADKVPQGVQEPAWNQTRAVAYSLMAADAYAQKDNPKAIELYTRVSKFAPQADEPYYYIGMCKWRSQDPEGAIESFAKATVLGKAMAKRSQEYLEQLWKARHKDTLDGLDQVLAKAKSELGIN